MYSGTLLLFSNERATDPSIHNLSQVTRHLTYHQLTTAGKLNTSGQLSTNKISNIKKSLYKFNTIFSRKVLPGCLKIGGATLYITQVPRTSCT